MKKFYKWMYSDRLYAWRTLEHESKMHLQAGNLDEFRRLYNKSIKYQLKALYWNRKLAET